MKEKLLVVVVKPLASMSLLATVVAWERNQGPCFLDSRQILDGSGPGTPIVIVLRLLEAVA